MVRVFAAVLTGRVDRQLPPAPTAGPVWGVLLAAMDGKITTAEEFRTRLAEHPLSEHWTEAKPAVERRKKSALPLLLLLLLFLIGGGGGLAGLYFGGVFDPKKSDDTQAAAAPTPKATEPTTSKKAGPAVKLDRVEVDWKNRPPQPPDAGPEFDELLKQFDAAKDPQSWLEVLQRMYDQYATGDEATRAKMRPWS